MPNPTLNNARIDQLATDLAVTYSNDPEGYAGDLGATLVKRTERGGKYPKWSKDDLFRSEMKLVSNNDAAPVGGLRLTTPGTYYADGYGLKTFLADKDVSESQVDLRNGKVKWLTEQAKIKREQLYAAAAFGTGLWTANTEQTGKSSGESTNEFRQFGDEASTPIRVVQDQMQVVQLACGRMPNAIITNSVVEMALRRHPDILDLFKYTAGGLATREQLAAVFGVKKFIVGQANYNSAKEGQTGTMARIFGNHMLLAFVADAWTEEQPTAVAGFSWAEYDKVTATGVAIKSWRENDPEGEWLKSECYISYNIVANDMGVFLKDAVIPA